MAAASLLGPPEIYRPQPAADPFMDAMVSQFNSITTRLPNGRGYTENMSITHLSSGNPCLDFFFHVVPDTPSQSLVQRLLQSWHHNPLTTLKLICNLRGVRGTGKSDKQGYYTSALWLHQNHPKTLASNLAPMAEFGYFKDFPEILYRLLQGADVRAKAKQEHSRRSSTRGKWRRRFRGRRQRTGVIRGVDKKNKKKKKKNKKKVSREDRVLAEMKRVEMVKAKASKNRQEKKIAMAKKAVERYRRDPDYKLLHERVSDLFADYLRCDINFLAKGELKNISLAAKWCPSLDSSFDKTTLLCESIAKKVFPVEEYREYDGLEEAHYAYRVRDRLRKQVLVPLRKALELPEVYIGQNQWGQIPYNRVASVAMKLYKEKFLKHDKARFEEYLEKVKSGKATIAAGALLPHEIISSLGDGDGGRVAELQWKRMVDDMGKKGKLNNCLAICDVSGSMSGIPMEVSVALGVLVSELSEEPWKGKVITFSEDPKLHMVEGDDLESKTKFVRQMEWGMNTDFQKVFDVLLEVAVKGKLREDEMIKRLLVFSDMEFDQACANNSWTSDYSWGEEERGNPWETDYEVIVSKYREKGYGVPEIVFWNLRDSKATPVTGNQKGVALVSGYSKNLMTLFLEDDGSLNPEAVMEAAISGEHYNKLVVLD